MKKCKLFMCDKDKEYYLRTFNSFDEAIRILTKELYKHNVPIENIETYTRERTTIISYGSMKYFYKIKRYNHKRK